MRVSVQVELEIDVDPAATPAAFVRDLSEAVALMLRGPHALLMVRGDNYVLGPHCTEEPAMGAWLARGAPEPPEHASVRLHRAETCMHGSPSVPGGGFLCGWCCNRGKKPVGPPKP